MNLNTLFTPQKELDEHILNEKGLHGQDLLKKKTVALICELYECVNEARFFKFWSEDQEAVTYTANPDDMCEVCNGNPILYNDNKDKIIGQCDNCDGCGFHFHNPLLEEFSDVVHFTISIANDIGYTEHKYIKTDHTDLNDLVIGITNIATIVPLSKEHKHMRSLMNSVIQLGYQLGFDEEQVIDAYFDKNKENHQRQESGY